MTDALTEFFAAAGAKVRFPDDQDGTEARMLLAAYGERLTDQVKSHAPITEILRTTARINEILAAGIDHLLDQARSEDVAKTTTH